MLLEIVVDEFSRGRDLVGHGRVLHKVYRGVREGRVRCERLRAACVRIVRDQGIAEHHNVWGAPPALGDRVGHGAGHIRWKRTHAFGVGMPEAVNGLVVVPDHKHRRCRCERVHELLIRLIQILELVHEDVLQVGEDRQSWIRAGKRKCQGHKLSDEHRLVKSKPCSNAVSNT